jgi:hypothetical protein
MVAALKVSPSEPREEIDYHREREKQLADDAAVERFLADASTKLASSLNVDATARVAVHLAVPRLADAALLWLEGQEEPPRAWFAHVHSQRERTVETEIEGLAPSDRQGAHRHPGSLRAPRRRLPDDGGMAASVPRRRVHLGRDHAAHGRPP